jgi:pimeloyl-ACP methyl ester carboxylesterase
LGGAVASVFAHYYPECVLNLALLCPAMKTPVFSEANKKILEGKNKCFKVLEIIIFLIF